MCYAEPASDTVLPGYYREKCWFFIMLNNPVLGRVCKEGKAETQARTGPAARCSTELCDKGDGPQLRHEPHVATGALKYD